MKHEAFVAIDLETTGLAPERCSIIEFGAARVAGGEVTARFSMLARPAGPLPAAITRLTGITDAELSRAPESEHALAEFLEFLGKDPLVAHNAEFESSFLRAATAGRFTAEILDSLELARIVVPEAPGHSLGRLARELRLETGERHRALADAELCARLWLVLLERLEALPLPVLTEAVWTLNPTMHPLKPRFAAAEKRAVARLGADVPGYSSLFKAGPAAPREGFEPGEPPRLDSGRLAAELAPGGALAGKLPGYEPRREQQEMCRRVAAALDEGRHLVVEAGTGVGKSLAYLLPAAAWSESGARKVVVSTNTKNLQSQLFERDLPLLEKALGRSLDAALLKGRKNYLCLRKFFGVLRQAESELDEAERAAILPVLVWAPQSATGDLADCTPLGLPEARDLPDKLTTDGPDCLGGRCEQRRRCFLFRARARAQAARLIVANHSLVLAELRDSAVLPAYAECVFDEAHNLEAAATRHLSVEIRPGRFYRAMNRLFRFRRGGGGRRRRRRSFDAEIQGLELSGTGLLPSVFEQLGRAGEKAAPGFLELARKRAQEASAKVVSATDALSGFSAALAGLWASSPPGQKLRYSGGQRREDLWEPVRAAKEKLVAELAALKSLVGGLSAMLLEDDAAEEIERAEELGRDLVAASGRVAELIEDTDFTVRADDPRYVYWAELPDRINAQPELYAAPLDVGPQLAELVFAQKRCCILSSATMTVAGKFDYLLGRLGLSGRGQGAGVRGRSSGFGVPSSGFRDQAPEFVSEEPPDADGPAPTRNPELGTRNPGPGTRNCETLLLGTPFDFRAQCRVLVPSWLPEPGGAAEGRNSRELAEMLAPLFRTTRGRALVLFTSYGALDEAGRALRPLVEPDGITVLAQGQDGSRESLLDALRGEENVVLLGTSSFWEGVDVRGEALSCLVIARLPFQVFTEPLFQARSELVESRGESAFMNYSLPEAVLKFRQGFGRLIRSKTDRGIAVLADKRLLSKRYGRVFLQSLPGPWRAVATAEQLVRAAEEFFGEG